MDNNACIFISLIHDVQVRQQNASIFVRVGALKVSWASFYDYLESIHTDQRYFLAIGGRNNSRQGFCLPEDAARNGRERDIAMSLGLGPVCLVEKPRVCWVGT